MKLDLAPGSLFACIWGVRKWKTIICWQCSWSDVCDRWHGLWRSDLGSLEGLISAVVSFQGGGVQKTEGTLLHQEGKLVQCHRLNNKALYSVYMHILRLSVVQCVCRFRVCKFCDWQFSVARSWVKIKFAQHFFFLQGVLLREILLFLCGSFAEYYINGFQPEWYISTMIYIVEVQHSGRKPSILRWALKYIEGSRPE